MKKILIIVVIFSQYSCFNYHVFKNDGTTKETKTLIKGYSFQKHKSISSDGFQIKGIHAITDEKFENCFTKKDLEKIKVQLKKQSCVSKINYILRPKKLLPNSCDGLYFLGKTYDRKSYNGISIPLLKINDEIVLNTVYVDGKYCEGDSTLIKNQIQNFIAKNNGRLPDKDLKEIKKYFLNGVNVHLKGILR